MAKEQNRNNPAETDTQEVRRQNGLSAAGQGQQYEGKTNEQEVKTQNQKSQQNKNNTKY